jgi:hypothetical protein
MNSFSVGSAYNFRKTSASSSDNNYGDRDKNKTSSKRLVFNWRVLARFRSPEPKILCNWAASKTMLKNMQLPKSKPSPERLTQFAFGFAPPLILQTAVELRIFDLIDASPMSLEELSSKTGASVRGLRALLNALVGFEFLSKDDGGLYVLTPESEAFLVRNKPAFRGDFFTFVPGMIQHWLNLKDSVKSGKPAVAINSEPDGAEFFREFVKSLFNINFAPATTLATEFKGKREIGSILDLATGSGVWGIRIPQRSATGCSRSFAANSGNETVVAHDEGVFFRV